MLRRPLLACLLLFAVYAALSLVNDPHGSLGTDTGGKVATLRTMQTHGNLNPDVGYWAEQWDPDGVLHPLYYTAHIDDKWVNVTTLPVLYLAEPLYRAGGYRLTLLLPMLGSVAAALAARALAKRLGGEGWMAFWVVGLLSPLVLYAIDFWEHSIGVALMGWAIVLLVALVDDRRRGRRVLRALGAGILFGAAATLRTEALVYAGIATAAVCVVVLWRERRLGGPVLAGLAVVIGLAIPLAGNVALERATIGGTVRTARTSGTATEAGHGARVRLKEGLLTAVGLQPEVSWTSSAVGAAALVLLAFAYRLAKSGAEDRGPAVVAGAGAAGLYAVRFAQGLGFVPGMTAASPVAGIGLVEAQSNAKTRLVAGIALLALPVVWAFQYLGGAYAQWGGRYILVSGFLLAVVGAVGLERAPRRVAGAVLALAAAVTGFGLVWMSSRTHDVARAEAALYARRDPALISRLGHLAREGGAYYRYGGRPWLTAVTGEALDRAVDVVRKAGLPGFAIVDDGKGRTAAFDGFVEQATSHMDFLGLRLRLTSYRADTPLRG